MCAVSRHRSKNATVLRSLIGIAVALLGWKGIMFVSVLPMNKPARSRPSWSVSLASGMRRNTVAKRCFPPAATTNILSRMVASVGVKRLVTEATHTLPMEEPCRLLLMGCLVMTTSSLNTSPNINLGGHCWIQSSIKRRYPKWMLHAAYRPLLLQLCNLRICLLLAKDQQDRLRAIHLTCLEMKTCTFPIKARKNWIGILVGMEEI
mmetsp:Transcript_15847/g.34435  ORF Transcript_15847/g.34435 Transcript_15847/m.34435 type:complete len:206 (-) Transcript_15847:1295-1912(-)